MEGDAMSGGYELRGQARHDCAVLVEKNFRHQIGLWRQCQNQALAKVDGVWLCGTHINASARGALVVHVMFDAHP
jgi:hypothetical protein